MTATRKLQWVNSRGEELSGVRLYLVGICLMAVMDASAKWLTASYPVIQLVFFESLFGAAPAVVALSREGAQSLLTRRWPLLTARAILSLGTISFFFGALKLLPLAEVTMIVLVAPLLVPPLAIVLLKEKLSLHYLTATFAGLCGALLILQPGTWTSTFAVLMPLGSALCYAATLVITRSLARTESPATIVIYHYAILLSVSGALLPASWSTPNLADLPIYLLMGLCGGLSIYSRTKACRYAPANLLAPLDYTGIVWAILLGFMVWGDLPSVSAFCGAILIAASGIFVMRSRN